MLTPKQERFCQNLETKRMSQRAAYLDAFPASKKWKPSSVDEAACRLAKESKILSRLKELRADMEREIKQEAKWTREDAFKNLEWLLKRAKEEADKGELTSPCVSAITNAVKELNNLYNVNGDTKGRGVLEEILGAVRGIDND